MLERLAVCTWSLQPANPQQLVEQLRRINIPRVQLALDPLRDQPAVWGSLPALLKSEGIAVVSGMFGTVGEDYTTMESIRRTGGVLPDETWAANWRNIQATARQAAELGLSLVTFHAGFLPHDPKDPAFDKIRKRITEIARVFAEHKVDLGFETGQETAETLRAFLELLGQPNVGVNFDPANMILYDKGDPIAALRTLAPWLKQCHIKDARRTKTPGHWGDEVVAGTGEVSWPDFFATLRQVNFQGFLAIEREAGNQRVDDIRSARQFLESLPQA
jgi:L-ribulose-5-phosphate 3-epimerase